MLALHRTQHSILLHCNHHSVLRKYFARLKDVIIIPIDHDPTVFICMLVRKSYDLQLTHPSLFALKAS